jgi:hypothetical protein
MRCADGNIAPGTSATVLVAAMIAAILAVTDALSTPVCSQLDRTRAFL